MRKLDGTLGNYVGIGMAAMILGRSPEQTGVVYDLIKAHDITVFKRGGVSLIKADDFFEAADIDDKLALWPNELAILPMDSLYSRQALAAKLGVSIGTIHRLARAGGIVALDLSEWNMNSLYYYTEYDEEQYIVPMVVGAWGHSVKLSLENGELHIRVLPESGNALKAECFGLEPNKAWFTNDYGGPEIVIEIQKKENA